MSTLKIISHQRYEKIVARSMNSEDQMAVTNIKKGTDKRESNKNALVKTLCKTEIKTMHPNMLNRSSLVLSPFKSSTFTTCALLSQSAIRLFMPLHINTGLMCQRKNGNSCDPHAHSLCSRPNMHTASQTDLLQREDM
jgi:hypothetical protein